MFCELDEVLSYSQFSTASSYYLPQWRGVAAELDRVIFMGVRHLLLLVAEDQVVLDLVQIPLARRMDIIACDNEAPCT